jgi:hypothetical protein
MLVFSSLILILLLIFIPERWLTKKNGLICFLALGLSSYILLENGVDYKYLIAIPVLMFLSIKVRLLENKNEFKVSGVTPYKWSFLLILCFIIILFVNVIDKSVDGYSLYNYLSNSELKFENFSLELCMCLIVYSLRFYNAESNN